MRAWHTRTRAHVVRPGISRVRRSHLSAPGGALRVRAGAPSVAAKAVGMRVERFSLFFGPMPIKRTWGETEYGIGVIPLGGYVKITGMTPNEELPPEVVHRAYYNQAVWKRVVTILAGPVVNIVIAFAIVWGL